MNALAIIQKKLQREQKIQDYNRSVAYRGVKYEVCHENGDTHGTFCYRGRTYVK